MAEIQTSTSFNYALANGSRFQGSATTSKAPNSSATLDAEGIIRLGKHDTSSPETPIITGKVHESRSSEVQPGSGYTYASNQHGMLHVPIAGSDGIVAVRASASQQEQGRRKSYLRATDYGASVRAQTPDGNSTLSADFSRVSFQTPTGPLHDKTAFGASGQVAVSEQTQLYGWGWQASNGEISTTSAAGGVRYQDPESGIHVNGEYFYDADSEGNRRQGGTVNACKTGEYWSLCGSASYTNLKFAGATPDGMKKDNFAANLRFDYKW